MIDVALPLCLIPRDHHGRDSPWEPRRYGPQLQDSGSFLSIPSGDFSSLQNYTHDGALFAVAIGSGPDLDIGDPERVATVNLVDDPSEFPAYVVADDESLVTLDRWQEGPHPVVVLNWFTELERLVPTR